VALVTVYTSLYIRRTFDLPYCFQIRAVGSFLLNWFVKIYICVPSLKINDVASRRDPIHIP
jgi:hypothetical protein